jgi:HAD superfamily hydrolase (TIGR01509 family)
MIGGLRSSWPDAVLFDCDGVLVDSEGVTGSVISEWAIRRLGLDIQAARRLAGNTLGRPTATLVENPLVLSAGIGPQELDELDQIIDRAARANIRIMTGVAAVLRRIPVTKAVVSNAGLDWVKMVVARIDGGATAFEERLFCNILPAKPDPAPYWYAAERLDVVPARCIAIEDSRHGIAAATAAGMRVIGFAQCPETAHLLIEAGAVTVVPEMAAIPATILRIAAQ